MVTTKSSARLAWPKAGLAIALVAFVGYQIGQRGLAEASQNLASATLLAYLAVFFAIVGLRYVVLICFSFMEHVDSLVFDREMEDQDDDAMMPFITIVVPAYNEGLLIKQSIASLLELDYPRFEVLVIDDGSTDDTYVRAKEMALQSERVPVRVITKRNGGKSDALNVGMAHARGSFILNMDGDTVLSRNVLRVCIRHFRDPRVGAVAGSVKIYNRENLVTRMQALEYIEGLAMAKKAQSYMRICNIVPGPLGMFRKDALQEVRGYDHDTFAEDCDLTFKLLMRGWHIAYEARAIAWVETPSRLLDLIKQRYRWSRGIVQTIAKHKQVLFQPKKSGINFYILWYMGFENVVWPVTSVISNLVFIYMGLTHGVILLLLYWWLQLTLLDVIAATFCVVMEREDISMVAYAPFFRIFYVLFIDVVKVFANLEEFLGLKMSWGKLERQGKL